MNKKVAIIIISLIVLLALGWFAYRALDKNETEVITESGPDIQTVAPNTPPSLKTVAPKQIETEEFGAISGSKKVQEDNDTNFEVFDHLEKAWLQRAQNIIGGEKYPMYLDMRNRSDKEKMQAYKEYHDYLRQKYGDKFSYNISDDQSVREKEINQRYLKELLDFVGPLKFKEYTSAKDQFNEEMRRKNKEAIQIEF